MSSRVAVVTGGTRGIGAAISKKLKESGCTVIATYARNTEKAEAFAAETGIAIKQWDVADYEACAVAIKAIEEEFGAVDVLVNNAGITKDATLHKMDPAQWKDVVETNLTSCFNMCRAVINGMRDRKFGRIVNISSINGLKGQFGQANYAASKAGIRGFTKSIALENAAKGITANVVAPGYTDTDMVAAVPEKVLEQIIAQIPAGRLGNCEDIARTVSFLAADEGGFITGETINVNGGQYMV